MKKPLIAAALMIASTGMALAAENFVICTVVPGKHDLYAFPDGPLRGQQAAGKVLPDDCEFDCGQN
jgi:hypothetical protein